MPSGGQLPVVRYFIPCDEARRWQGGGAYSLTRVRHSLRGPAGGGYLRTYPELWFYLQVTDGTGRHTFRIHQVCIQDQTLIYRWPAFQLDLQANPAAVHELAVRLPHVVFWRPGQYEFALFEGADQLAAAEIDVR
jgi:hypothetical protein